MHASRIAWDGITLSKVEYVISGWKFKLKKFILKN